MGRKWVLNQQEEWVRIGSMEHVHALALREFEKKHHNDLRGVGADERLELYLTFRDKEKEQEGKKPVEPQPIDDVALAEQEAASPDNQADGHKAPTDLCIVCGRRVPRNDADAGNVCDCPTA